MLHLQKQLNLVVVLYSKARNILFGVPTATSGTVTDEH
jgi:hypothetical protein